MAQKSTALSLPEKCCITGCFVKQPKDNSMALSWGYDIFTLFFQQEGH